MSKYYKVVCPEVYYNSFIDENVRPDGRAFTESRKINIQTEEKGGVDGSSLVFLGSTIVTCAIIAEVTEIKPGDSVSDFIDLSVDMPHLSRQHLRNEQALNPCLHHQQIIQSLLLNSECLDLKQFYNEDAKHFWRLRCEMVVMNDDGSVMDAMLLCLVACLQNTRLPRVRREESGLVVERGEGGSIEWKDAYISTSYGILHNGELVADVSADEILEGGSVMLMSSLFQQRSFPLYTRGASLEVIKKCHQLSRSRIEEINKLLPTSLY